MLRIIHYAACWSFILLICTACDVNEEAKSTLSYINPLLQASIVGEKTFLPSTYSKSVPTIGTPFGMVHWTPETQTTSATCNLPFDKKGEKIQGFRLTHISNQTCSREYGGLSLMMKTGSMQQAPPEKSSAFTMEGKTISPAYFGAELTDFGIFAEISATDRTGLIQFHFSKKDTAIFFLNIPTTQEASQVNFYPHANEVWVKDSLPNLYPNWPASGSLNAHYLIQVHKAITDYGIWEGALIQPKALEVRGSGENKGLYLKFPVDSGEVVQIKVASSYWNIKAARFNLTDEIPDWNFEQVKKSGEKKWEDLLTPIRIQASDEEKVPFYQLLYYCAIMPRIFSGSDGLYPAFAETPFPYKKETGDFYGDFSMWETLSDPHPQLLSLLFPERMKDMKESLEILAEQADTIPIFSKAPENVEQLSLVNLASEEILNTLGLRLDSSKLGVFVLKAPTVASWELDLGQGKSFTLVVENFQEGENEVSKASLNGQNLDKLEISIEQIHAGGNLEIGFQ